MKGPLILADGANHLPEVVGLLQVGEVREPGDQVEIVELPLDLLEAFAEEGRHVGVVVDQVEVRGLARPVVFLDELPIEGEER